MKPQYQEPLGEGRSPRPSHRIPRQPQAVDLLNPRDEALAHKLPSTPVDSKAKRLDISFAEQGTCGQ